MTWRRCDVDCRQNGGGWWIEDLKGSGGGLIEVLYLIGVESLRKATKNAVGIAGVLTESRARHLLHINIWRYFEVRLVGTVLLHAPVHALSSSYTHLCLLRPVLFHPHLAPSCSVPSTSSCSVLFCSNHVFLLRPFLFHPRLLARSYSVTCTPSCSVLFCSYHVFVLVPVLLLYAPLHAPSCSVPSTSSCSFLFSC